MKEIIKKGKTVDEAINIALEEAGVLRENVEIEVLSEGNKGIFGIGSKEAEVKIIIKENCAGDIAKDFVENVLKKLNMAANVDVNCDEDRVNIDISGENMGIIIGRRGETLDAVQHVSQLYINKTCEKFYKVIVDTEDYRAKREEALKNLAQGLAKKVLKTRKEIALEPMKAYERRIIHTALQGYNKIVTHSVGVEPNRRLVVGYKYTPRVNKDEKQETTLENTEE